MKRPARCLHLKTEKVEEAKRVYGTPGVTPARYRCLDCDVYWDSYEPPEETTAWFKIETKGPQA